MMGDFGFAEVEIRDGFIVSAVEATGSEWQAESSPPRRWRSARLLTHAAVLLIAVVPISITVASARATTLQNSGRIGSPSNAAVPGLPSQSSTAIVQVAAPPPLPGHAPVHYRTQNGDTWVGLAARFKVAADELAWSNLDSGSQLTAGTVLHVPPVRGIVAVAGAQDTVEALARTFQVPPTAIATFNPPSGPGAIPAGTELVIPGATPPSSAAVPADSALALRCPVSQPVLSQAFGPSSLLFEPSFGAFSHFHMGLDLTGPYGTPVLASTGGTVAASGFTLGGYGLRVEVVDALGRRELYGHLERASVANGDKVAAGDVLGLMGSTGLSTGPHVHFELQVDGRPVDPAPLAHC